jgi:hypothetical protein
MTCDQHTDSGGDENFFHDVFLSFVRGDSRAVDFTATLRKWD